MMIMQPLTTMKFPRKKSTRLEKQFLRRRKNQLPLMKLFLRLKPLVLTKMWTLTDYNIS